MVGQTYFFILIEFRLYKKIYTMSSERIKDGVKYLLSLLKTGNEVYVEDDEVC